MYTFMFEYVYDVYACMHRPEDSIRSCSLGAIHFV